METSGRSTRGLLQCSVAPKFTAETGSKKVTKMNSAHTSYFNHTNPSTYVTFHSITFHAQNVSRTADPLDDLRQKVFGGEKLAGKNC